MPIGRQHGVSLSLRLSESLTWALIVNAGPPAYATSALLKLLTSVSRLYARLPALEILPPIWLDRGTNVPRDVQTVRVARKLADELNAYDEEVQKVVGIFAPHLGASHIHETRTTEWRIVRKSVDLDVDPLTLKSASGAPRSPVNNCGEVLREPDPDMQVATPEYLTAVMNLIKSGDVSWDDADVAKTLRDAIRGQSSKANHQEIARNRKKSRNDAPSARLTSAERARIPQIRLELAQQGSTAELWILKILSRGCLCKFWNKNFCI